MGETMEDQVLISAIITTCKRPPEMLKRAINSVLSQTYRNIELIVVDDSPADYPERKAVEQLVLEQKKTSYIQHEKNCGACAARNTGIRYAKGKYVAFLDDDDEWLPRKLELQITKMADDTVGLVYCNYYIIDEVNNTKKKHRCSGYRGNVYDLLIQGNFIGSTSYPLIRKACFDECGPFDPEMKSLQDYDVWLRIAQKYKVEFVDEYLVNYYAHTGQRITKNPAGQIEGIKRIMGKHIDYLRQHPRAYALKKLQITKSYFMNREYWKGLRAWLFAVRICPGNAIENLLYLLRCIKWFFVTLFSKNRKDSR